MVKYKKKSFNVCHYFYFSTLFWKTMSMKCSNWREREEVKEMGGELIHKTVTIWKLYACVYFDNLTGYKKII